MELTGTHNLPESPDVVWKALFDPVVLAACIPGCQSLSPTGDMGYAAEVKLKVGPVAARFKGDVAISDVDAPRACTLSGKGSGGIAGFAKGAARVTLTPEGSGTRLDYTADAAVGGKLASLGGRLIQSTARKLTDQFFTDFTAILTGEKTLPDQVAPESQAQA